MRLGQTSFVGFITQFSSSIIGFVATIYITRTFGSGVFGEYMLIISVVIWLQIVGIFGIQNAVTKRLSEAGDSDGYFSAGAGISLLLFITISLTILVFSDQINRYLGTPVANYLPALLLAGMALKFVSAGLRGEHKVHIAAMLEPVDRTVRSSLQIVIVFLSFGLVGLLTSYVVGGVLAALCGVYFLTVGFERPKRRHFRGISSYAQYAWLGKFSSRAFSAMDTVILGVFVTSSFIGYYEAAWNLASILAIFGVSISQALFPEMSQVASEGDSEQVGSLVTDALSYTGLFLIPGFVGSLLVGDLVLRVYGDGFDQAMPVLVILIVARLVYEYGNQFITGLNALDRPDIAFRVNAVFIITNMILNVGLVATMGWTGAAVATGGSAVVTTILAYILFDRLVTIELPWREIGNQCAAAFGMGIFILVCREFLPENVFSGVALVGVGAIVYISLLFVLSTQFRATVLENLPKYIVRPDSG